MKTKELRQKSKEELLNTLTDAKARLNEKRFLLSQKKLKNFKEIKELKKDVARILTLLKQ